MAGVEALVPIPSTAPPDADGALSSAEVAVNSQELAISEATQDGEKKAVKKVIKKKRRPARPQVDPSTLRAGELPPQTGTVFNIWYNKWSGGDREDKYASKVHAESRCNIAKDSGYTRADKVPGSYFCLFFARGLCPKGHECDYLHRLPTIHDLFNPNIDCFGRDKHSDYRDDMGGVGSFMRQNRTLYVGRIHVSDDIEEIVARHFAEWGQIERIRVLNSRGVAFVTYSNEANSQFAKEAMAHQSLDHNEILNVRWATVDPNPMAQAREKRKIEEQAAEAVRKALPADFVAEIEGKDPEARKRKRIEGSFGLTGYDAPDEVWYARDSTAVNPSGRQSFIESGGQLPPATAETGEKEEEDGGGGIISGSTLAALKSYSAQNKSGMITVQASKAAVSQGPLVAYGSDDDSD
ncbi:Pre-mRNA-splicing factor [Trichoglossum hirsutum]|uniref:Pre-mRNA-splicing factor CWC2 n=1 Tax=Trichoglossum hirsutum TaxID=265104 RepID=A0A9P8RRD5_9PEZI|nr:Pre-mRNA-splicing factor [Trichoglossum hirsutum]